MWIELPPYRLWESRTGEGSPVALIHGLSGSGKWWSRNIDVLAQSHLVAAIDMVGFGRSQRFAIIPKVIPRFSEATALLARWLESFGEPVHVIGHSMGGQLAIRLAAERPDLVRSLVLVGAPGMPFAARPAPHLRPLPRTPITFASLATRVIVPDVFRAGPMSIAVATGRILRDDARDWMHRIVAPTLLVWGAQDAFVPLAYGRAMEKEIQGAHLHVIEDGAHVPMWEAAGEFNKVVGRFLEDVDRHPRSSAAFAELFTWGVSGSSDGVAWRQAGRRRDVVLVHGLGMASSYFERFARALFERGWHPIAPDLPGFGVSADAPGSGPEVHADALAKWADRIGVRDAAWVGHSTGSHAVALLARRRPDLVRTIVSMGPLWTRRRFFRVRLAAMFITDVFREPWRLVPIVARSYWRAGFRRWLSTYRGHFHDIETGPVVTDVARADSPVAGEARHRTVVGERDPIPDRPVLTRAGLEPRVVPGAHACHFSHPNETAEVVSSLLKE
jgi:pimeloyl-ACP methyl ester carboxylesterase